MAEHYDVGIFGLWYGHNYGSIITYYALSQVIENMGYSYTMIKNPLGANVDVNTLRRSHSLRFASEHYPITPLYKLNEMSKLNGIIDRFILGSDQMWNYGLSKPYGQSYFFDFVDDDRTKISYATSFGKEKYNGPEEEKRITSINLQRFSAISVRDDFSRDILKKDFGVESTIVCDPVFLCPVEKYEDLVKESELSIDGKYIFAYILDPNPTIGEQISEIAENNNINIYVCFNESGDKNRFKELLSAKSEKIICLSEPTVNEWLYLFKNAEFILTDSFHGSCFSIIFKKPFIVKKNRNRGGARFDCLLNTFDLTDHMIDNEVLFREKFDRIGMNFSIDYDKAYKKAENHINASRKWLENALRVSEAKSHHEELKKIHNSVCTVPLNCTGCSACAAVCPKNAITMKENTEGFLNPEVDPDKCVDCGLCVKRCVDLNPQYRNVPRPKCYAMTADDNVRKISSSGGMFTVAAEYILDQGGYVCGAAYNDDFTVKHIIIDNKEDLYKLRGSKYMQSHIGKIYRDIKALLDNDKIVLFTGMPCQVAGLYSYLNKNYDKLYTIDLLCHGITSSKVFEKYHNDVLDGKKMNRLEFKEKEPWGWHAGVNAYFTDGTKYSKPLESDMYFIAYLKSIAKNTTCGVCKLNRLPRQGDLTIGDFWGIAHTDKEMYDGKGTSVVLANNEKGVDFFDKLKSRMQSWKEEPLQNAINGNRIIEHPYRLHKNRNEFFANFDKLDFESLTRGCYFNTLYLKQYEELKKTVPSAYHELYYLAKTASEKSNGRKIVTWIRSEKFENILEEHFSKKVEFSVARSPSLINNTTVFPLEKIKNQSQNYYIVALDPEYSVQQYGIMEEYGYHELDDFIFRRHKPIVLENFDCSSGRYADEYGNTIDGWNAVIGRVVFRGCNSHIVLGREIGHANNLTLDITSNSIIQIGEKTRFNRESRIQVMGYTGNSEITIKEDCRFTDALIRIYNNSDTSSILINEKCTFETNLEIHVNSGKKLIIGRDSMLSHNIDLWAGDGHTIFDVRTGNNLNSDSKSLPEQKNMLVIGEHVWVGKGAFVMHGTNIGDGSVVGAMSVVKGKYPNNCSIAGNPASVVRKDIAWSREIVAKDMNRQCGGEKYVKLTHNEE